MITAAASTGLVLGGFAVMTVVALAVVAVVWWLVVHLQDHEPRIAQRETDSVQERTDIRGLRRDLELIREEMLEEIAAAFHELQADAPTGPIATVEAPAVDLAGGLRAGGPTLRPRPAADPGRHAAG